jgi:hypothetical protein
MYRLLNRELRLHARVAFSFNFLTPEFFLKILAHPVEISGAVKVKK